MGRNFYWGEFSGWPYRAGRQLGHNLRQDPGTQRWVSGFRPDPPRRELADAILAVFATYRAQGLLPIGPRGVGYRLEHQTIGGRLVVKGKEATAAERHRLYGPHWTFTDIGETLVELRRARELGWDDVDDGRTVAQLPMVAHDLAAQLRADADAYDPDQLYDQSLGVELWIEAQGGFGLWRTISWRWGVPVYSGSGMTPAAAAHEAARRWHRDRERHPEMLVILVTDLDVAGYTIADRFAADTRAFVADYGDQVKVDFERLALTEAQVLDQIATGALTDEVWGPAKGSGDHQLARTAEAEALPPEVARDLFNDLMEDRLDGNRIEATKAAWAAQVEDVKERLADPGDED
jgi:hypothetical protein